MNMRAKVRGCCLIGYMANIRALDAKRRSFGNASKLPGEDPISQALRQRHKSSQLRIEKYAYCSPFAS